MIAYDLRCEEGHEFEAWFKNLRAFELQRKRKLIECPRCGTLSIALVYRASTIRRQALRKNSSGSVSSRAAKMQKFLDDHFEDVGSRFPEEARRVHYGESEPRNIRGEASPQETKSLRDEGVPVITIVIPKASH